jgi:adenylate kinase
VYHERFNPPKQPGICDVCGGELYQRPDDQPETQRRRIRVYLEQTAPLIEYFKERGLLVEIDGEQDVESVRQAVEAALEPVLGGHA